MKETFFILVITMWGNTGSEWEYIGNQIALQQELTEDQCVFLLDDAMWQASYDNEFYQMRAHCFPADCAGKESC